MMLQEEIAEIETLIKAGFVTKRKHPVMELYILNYTHRAQYANTWTPTLLKCRGLIIDNEYNVVKRPFEKFFNLGEKTFVGDLPDEIPIITEKIEGFMGILYEENGMPAIATRGTFDSPMAVWATEWIRAEGFTMDNFLSVYTYIFEIIDPTLCRKQGLIINYGDRSECVLLAVIGTLSGIEIDHRAEARSIGLSYADVYTGTLDNAIAEMPSMNGTEKEGYVVRYRDGFRIKLKADEYKRLHRLLAGLTPKRILNTLIESGDKGLEDMLKDVPDESYARVHRIVDRIRDVQARIIEDGRLTYTLTGHMRTDPERAEVIHRSPGRAVAFAFFNGRNDKEIAHIALKSVRKIVKDIGDD